MALPQAVVVRTRTRPTRLTRARLQNTATERLLDVLLIVLILFMVAPIAFLLVSSFKTRSEVVSGAQLLPSVWQFQNYPEMWARVQFGKFLLNSLIICGSATLIATFLAALTGYALARFRFPGADLFSMAALGTQLIPGTLFLIPLFLTFLTIKNVTGVPLVGSNFGAIVLYVGFFLPMSLFILRSFFAAIPVDLEEQAMVDGCTRFGAFLRIALPLASPGLISTAVYVFLTAWDELVFAWVLNVQTIPVGIRLFTGVAGAQDRYELMSAAAVVVTIPVAVTFFVLQKRFVSGLTAGAVK
ncbi:MAG: carbohydrate ABC transporter permease [Chloroflexi bacterium]|nr:carbohydrate ABC transporter permease [Chloroflexota bacterium]MBV9546832.1 carbohydrate ABC transporter permease [Chloroflexota bacterium]